MVFGKKKIINLVIFFLVTAEVDGRLIFFSDL